MMIFSSHRSGRTTGAQRAALVGLAALLPVFAVVGAASPRGAGAGDTTPKVSICHATHSDGNPYVLLKNVDSSSIVNEAGHSGHTGDLWNPTMKADHEFWGDVIPSFAYGDGATYPGMNTDALDLIANECVFVTVTPVAPTVVPSTTCDVQGTYTIPATKGIVYLLDSKAIAAGTYNGPKTATITAQAKPGYLLEESNPPWSFTLNLPAAAVCPTRVAPVNPTFTLSSKCEVEGTYTIPATTGISYLLAGTPIAANTYQGPVSGTVTAQADTGYTLSTTNWSYALSVPAAVACPATVVVVVTPVNPTVVPSAQCNVQGTYTIPATTGITYLLGTTVKPAGSYDGPASGLVTAKANTGYTLSTTNWSYQLTVAAPEICPAAVVAPTAVVDAPTATTTGTTPTAETTAALPKTGFPTAALAGAAALALLLGVGLLAVGTRRSQADLS